jgi:hypothetical protein
MLTYAQELALHSPSQDNKAQCTELRCIQKVLRKRQPLVPFRERSDYPKVNGSSNVVFNGKDSSSVSVNMIRMDPMHSEMGSGA